MHSLRDLSNCERVKGKDGIEFARLSEAARKEEISREMSDSASRPSECSTGRPFVIRRDELNTTCGISKRSRVCYRMGCGG